MDQVQLITYALMLAAEADDIIMDLGHDVQRCEAALDEPHLEFECACALMTSEAKATLASLNY